MVQSIIHFNTNQKCNQDTKPHKNKADPFLKLREPTTLPHAI